MNKSKRAIFSSLFVFFAMTLAVYLYNYFTLQQPLSEVMNSDHRNYGINLDVHFSYYVQSSILVINMKNISSDNSQADVFRVVLQYSKKLKEHDFDWIEFASRGTTKFVLEGYYFKELGEEFGTQNVIYTMRTFPEKLLRPDGRKAFDTWSGGLLGVMGKQMEDLTEFHRKWYIEDMY